MAFAAERPQVGRVVEATAIYKFNDVVNIRGSCSTQNTCPLVSTANSSTDRAPVH